MLMNRLETFYKFEWIVTLFEWVCKNPKLHKTSGMPVLMNMLFFVIAAQIYHRSNCISEFIWMVAWLSQFKRQGQVSHFTILSDLSVHPLSPQHFLEGDEQPKQLIPLLIYFLNFWNFENFDFSLKDLCPEVGNRPTRTSGTSWPNSTSRLTNRSVFLNFIINVENGRYYLGFILLVK